MQKNTHTHTHTHLNRFSNVISGQRDLPDHVHHKDDVEDNEEVVCVPEDLIVGYPEKHTQIHDDDIYFYLCQT